MKRIVLTLALTAVASLTSLSAQETQSPTCPQPKGRPTPEMMMEKMTQELGLTDTQATAMKEIHEDFIEKQKQAMEMMKEAKEEKSEEIVKLLNDEQMAKYLDLKSRRRGPRNGQQPGPGQRKGPRGGAKNGQKPM